MTSQCQAITRAGKQCSRAAGPSGYCWQHEPRGGAGVGAGVTPTIPRVLPTTPQVPTILPTIPTIPPTVGISPGLPRIFPTIPRPLPKPPTIPPLPPVGAFAPPGVAPGVPFIPPALPTILPQGPLTRAEYLASPDPNQIPMYRIRPALAGNNLALSGTDEEERGRLFRFFDNPGPYRDLLGGTYSIGLGDPPLTVGQPFAISYKRQGIMGEGNLDLSRKPYDPEIKLEFPERTEGRPQPVPQGLDVARDCQGQYQVDPVSLESLSEVSSVELYVDRQKVCFSLPNIIRRWETSFASYDPQSKRVVPQYPSDFNNQPMEPQLVRNIYATALERKLDLEAYPLIKVLLGHKSLLEDLYLFITQYEQLQTTYQGISQLPAARGDKSLWSRRDLIAAATLGQIYEHNQLPNYGYRKYTDIPSGRNAPEIFYQCVLVSLFVNAGYRTVHFGVVEQEDGNQIPVDFQWILSPGQECLPILDRIPCRACVMVKLIPE